MKSDGEYDSYHTDKFGINPIQTQSRATTSSSQGTDATSPLFRYSEANVHRQLAKFVCATRQPFDFADNVFYENFAKLALNPSARRVSRSTLIRDIAKIVGEYKLVLINTFASLQQKVSICVDIWTDNYQTVSYMSVTSHWIDDTWTVQKRLIAFRYFPPPHSAQGIALQILTILQDYNLQQKVFSISFDNASANTASLPTLINHCQPICGGRFFHVRTLCHCLNLCVQDVLECFSDHINPIRMGITMIMKHQCLLKKWSKFCKNKGVHPKKFVWDDVPYRWNFIYKILSDSYEYKEVLCDFFVQNPMNDIQLFPQSWDSCSNLITLLKFFENAIKELSGCYYPTSPFVVDHCVQIALTFLNYKNDPILSEPISKMRTKCVKYFNEIPDVFLIAKMLDPRIKDDGLVELLKMYYEALFSDHDDPPSATLVVANVKEVFYTIFRDYKIQYGGDDSNESRDLVPSNSTASSQSIYVTSIRERLRRLYEDRSLKKARGSSSRNPYGEIDRYFHTTFEELDFDNAISLLKWWHRRSKAFPILSLIAKDILATPASTVSVESAFSTGGNILDDRRSRLMAVNVENQCLLGDWVKVEKRQQAEDFDFDEEGDYVPWETSTDSSEEEDNA